MQRINNFDLANKFIDEKVDEIRQQVGNKKVLERTLERFQKAKIIDAIIFVTAD